MTEQEQIRINTKKQKEKLWSKVYKTSFKLNRLNGITSSESIERAREDSTKALENFNNIF